MTGISSFIPLRFLIDITNSVALGSWKGIPAIGAQWSKLLLGKAVPCVFSLNIVERPKVYAAGMYALTMERGLPSRLLSSTISPRLWFKVL